MPINMLANAAKTIVDAAVDTAEQVIQTAQKTAETVSEKVSNFDVSDTFEKAKEGRDTLKEGFKALFGGDKSLGTIVHEKLEKHGVLDKLGLPEWVGPAIGAAVDFARGDVFAGYQNAMNLAGTIAETVGNDQLADFLDNAQNVVGMVRKTVGQAAMIYATGGTSAAGLLSQAGAAGQLSSAGQLLLKGVEIAGHIDKGIDIIDNLNNGDVKEAGKGIFGFFGGASDLVGSLLGDKVDTGLLGQVKDAMTGGGGILGDIAEKVFGGETTLETLKDNILGGIFEGLGREGSGLEALAKPAVLLLETLMNHKTDSPISLGTLLENAGFMDALTQGLKEVLGDVVMGTLGETDFNLGQFLEEVAQTVAGMLDMADLDPEAAKLIQDLLSEGSFLTETVSLSDLQAAFIRA